MLLCQTYANNLSINLDGSEKPILPVKYYPTPSKFLTCQASAGMPAKEYDLLQEVIDLINPYLESNDIQIILLGDANTKPLNKVIDLRGKTNFSQSVYILNHALLHFGTDSFCTHAAAETPIVALFGSTSVDCHSPYYFNSSSKFISSHRWGNNPSFQSSEPVKTINLIKPEEIAKSILEILNIQHNITQSTLYVGDLYIQNHSIDVIPDYLLPPQSVAPEAVLNLRADLYFDLNGIIANLQQRKYFLWLDREIDLNILKQLKPNIAAIIFEASDDTSPIYLQKIIRLGIQLNLWTRMAPEEHEKIKLDYLDLPLVNRKDDISTEQILDRIDKYNNKKVEFFIPKVKYLSKKHYLSQGKIYQSLYDWKIQKSVDNIESSSAGDLDNQDFRNEIDNFLIFVD